MELTPRTATEPPGPRPSRRRNPVVYVVLVAVLVGLGVVVYQALTSASLYFLNVDEAIDQRGDLGDQRFRLQGTVVGEPAKGADGEVTFVVAYDGARVDVLHEGGDPPELFQSGIPVVLEGRWHPDSDVYVSDRIIVKHSEEYEADHPDRIDDAEEGGDETGSTAP